MSSSSTIDFLKSSSNYATIYGGFILFFSGMIGNILNIIIFTSLKTFRETSAAFYMTVTSAVNVVQLIVSLFSRILITGFDIDPTRSSLVICKLREYLVTTLMLISFTCMCFAAMDQFFSLTDRWRNLCNTQVARRLFICSFFFWFLQNIPCSWFIDHVVSSRTNQTICTIINAQYSLYYSRFLFPILLGFLPLLVRVSFGLLAFIHVRSLQNRHAPIVRVERDKQLTMMVLVEVVVDVILTVPYSIHNHLYSSNIILTDPFDIALNQLLISIIRIIFYANFAISFYIYLCVSSRFRKQLAYVLVEIHLKHCRTGANRALINQVTPHPLDLPATS